MPKYLRKHHPRAMCSSCGARRPVYSYRGRFASRKDHSLCGQCFRAACQSQVTKYEYERPNSLTVIEREDTSAE